MTTQLILTIISSGIALLLYGYICNLWRKQRETAERLAALEAVG